MNTNLINPSASTANFYQPQPGRQRPMHKRPHAGGRTSFADALASYESVAAQNAISVFDSHDLDQIDLSPLAQFHLDEVTVLLDDAMGYYNFSTPANDVELQSDQLSFAFEANLNNRTRYEK